MSTKRILFEGQDVSMSTTMRKLMGTAEEMHRKNLEGMKSTLSTSKEIRQALEEEIKQKEKSQRLAGRNEGLRIKEEYEQRKRYAEALERDEEQRLRKQGLSGSRLDKAMGKFRTDVIDPKNLAAEDIRNTKEDKLKEQLSEQKTTNELLREILNQDTNQWEQEVREDKKNVERFVNQSRRTGFDKLPPEQRAKALFQQALLSEQEGGRGKGGKVSIIKDILGAGLIRDFGSILGQFPNARDGLDLVPGFARIGGGLVGAGVGAAAGALTLNPAGGATVGAELGQRAGEIAGGAISRFFNEREELEKGGYGFGAVTGTQYSGEGLDVNKFGLSSSEGFNVAKQMALSQGGGAVNIADLLGAETGFGLDRGSLMGFSKATRRTGKDFGDSMSNLLGTAKKSGIDQVLFNELVQGQTQLINTIGSMTEKVDPKNITALMMEMNRLEGGFSLKDPRSAGFIQTLNQGLTSPNEFGKAMNLSTLRNINPGGSILDLLEMEEQGLGGDKGREFLKGTVDQYNKMFGDEDLTVLALRSRFPGIPISDLKRLARGEGIGSMDTNQMNEGVDLQGEGNVSMRSQLGATVKDAFATGPLEGMLEVQDQFTEYFSKVFKEAAKDLNVTNIIKKMKGERPVDMN